VEVNHFVARRDASRTSRRRKEARRGAGRIRLAGKVVHAEHRRTEVTLHRSGCLVQQGGAIEFHRDDVKAAV
jgi:hypothetical protein